MWSKIRLIIYFIEGKLRLYFDIVIFLYSRKFKNRMIVGIENNYVEKNFSN